MVKPHCEPQDGKTLGSISVNKSDLVDHTRKINLILLAVNSFDSDFKEHF